MAYCTQTDILKRISQTELAQLTSETDTIDTAVVTEMIASADAEIDGYVGVRYSVPIDSPPKIINTCSVSIALYRLFERRANRLGGINESIKDAYENAVKTLDAIARGKISLGDPAPQATSVDEVDIAGSDRKYTMDTLKGF